VEVTEIYEQEIENVCANDGVLVISIDDVLETSSAIDLVNVNYCVWMVVFFLDFAIDFVRNYDVVYYFHLDLHGNHQAHVAFDQESFDHFEHSEFA